MKPYAEMTPEELTAEIAELKKEYKRYQNMELQLDDIEFLSSKEKPCEGEVVPTADDEEDIDDLL